MTFSSEFSVGFSGRGELDRLASLPSAANTAPVSPAFAWGVAAPADRDLVFQDSYVVSGGLRPPVPFPKTRRTVRKNPSGQLFVSNPEKYEEGEHGLQ